MAKSVISLMAVAIFSVLPVLLSGCGEKEITDGENVEVSLSNMSVSIPKSTVKMPLPFEFNGNSETGDLKNTLLENFQKLGYQTSVEEKPYVYIDMTDRVMHRVGDSKGRMTINASKDTPGDLRVRKDTVRVEMIAKAIISVSLQSEIVIEQNPDSSDQQTPDLLGKEMSVLQTAGQETGPGSDFEAEEVSRWLTLFKFESVSKDDKNKQFKRCASRYGATINDKDCFSGIVLEVDSQPRKLRAFYKDSATESTINEAVMPKLKNTYIEKFGQPDPREKKV